MGIRRPFAPYARAFLAAYRLSRRLRAKLFSVAASRSFAAFGRNSVIEPPIRLNGERHISIGHGVYVAPNCWLQVVGRPDLTIALHIGNDTVVMAGTMISAAGSVRIGMNVGIGRNVYVADHGHTFADFNVSVLKREITEPDAVEIADGAFIGHNVFIGPGVRVGRGAVVGANAVVLENVPDFAVAVGVPARVVRSRASGGTM